MTKAIIIAPFWHNPQHVGRYRAGRFVRWLAGAGVDVIVVCAGHSDRVQERAHAVEITLRDPLGLYGDAPPRADGSYRAPQRRPNSWRRALAYMLFNPDPTIVWARRATRHPLVLEHGAGARFVLSSSPPESPHLAAAGLAQRLGADLIVDMRDGWLDEPLRPNLRRSWLRRWREGRLERRILQQAAGIFVTSSIWKETLNQRLPFTRGKTSVLTNGYPESFPQARAPTPRHGRLTLVHAGRFTGSRQSQRVEHILSPLWGGIEASEHREGTIQLIGSLEPADLDAVAQWQPRFSVLGWTVETRAPVPREEVLEVLARADGLLLLSATRHVLPSKIFEYIPAKRPILCATPRDSAVWRVGRLAPQMFCVDYSQAQSSAQIAREFLDACAGGVYACRVPDEFTEEALSRIFLSALSI